MIHIDAIKVAINLLNSTLGLEDIPMEIHGRIATVLVLLDQQDGEGFFTALNEAYNYMGKDISELERFLEKWEDRHNQ